MTRLRKVMLQNLQRRNFSPATIRSYIGAVERFARYFHKPPDQLGPEQIREYQAHLLHARKLKAETVVAQVAALRFFFIRTWKRRFPPDSIPYPKYPAHHLPKVLSPEEVAQLIDALAISRHVPCSCCSIQRVFGEANWFGCVWRTSIANAWSFTSVRARGG